LWIDRIFPPEYLKPIDYSPEFCYVRGTPYDNPHLAQSYWDMLNTQPERRRRAWLDGDWDVFEGQVFEEWRRHVHVIKPFSIPDDWTRWRAVDWGYSAPFCCLWFARERGTDLTIVYREAYERGLTDPEQAEMVRDLTGEDEHIESTLADPSMWTLRTMERQTVTSADVYAKHGVPLRRADNDRMTGMRRVREALKVRGDDSTNLRIFENCQNLIRTLPALPYDKVRVEDVDTNAEDHAYDALRYGLSWRVRERRQSKAPADYWAPARR
jgi:phage terminase large subunit